MSDTVRNGTTLIAMALGLAGCGGGSSSAPMATANPPPAVVSPPPPVSDPPPADTGIAKYEPEFEALFSLEKVHTITIVISTLEWNALLGDFDANPRNENFRRADFYYGDSPGNGEFVADVGFRLRGNLYSRQRPEVGAGEHRAGNPLQRVHFRIKFNEQFKGREDIYGSREILTRLENKNRKFRTVRSLDLKYNKNDPTYTREVFSYDLFRRFGVQSLRQAYTRLYLRIGNGPTRYMGVYLMGEHMDKSWAQRRFGKNAFVFKSLYQGHGPADLSQADLDHNIDSGRIGAEITDPAFGGAGFDAYRPAFDLKTKRTDFAEAEARLNDLITLLTGNPTQEMLEQAIDIPALLRAQAVNVFLGNWDDYWRNGNNYYLALDPVRDKWVFVPYDYDIVLFDSIWTIDGIAEASFIDWGAGRLSGNPVLMQQVLSFEDFRNQYIGYLRELLGGDSQYASRDALLTRLREQQELIAPYLSGYDAIDHMPYDAGLDAIDDYVTRRIATARLEAGF